MAIDLEPRLLDQVMQILRAHVPECEVWAFGSRIGSASKKFSDLDLAIVAETALPTRRLAMLANAFEESDLPIKVDVMDWHTTARPFQQQIAQRHEILCRRVEPAFLSLA